MDAEVPVNCVARLRRHKNLKIEEAYKVASTVHQGKVTFFISRSTPTSSQSDNMNLAQNQPRTSVSFSSQESSTTRTSGLFSGANIGKYERCTFNLNFKILFTTCSKKRRFVLDSDSESIRIKRS